MKNRVDESVYWKKTNKFLNLFKKGNELSFLDKGN